MSVVYPNAKRLVAFLVLQLTLPLLLAADDLQKTQKKDLESAAKALNEEAKSLEKSGKLVEARLKYAESLGYLEQKEASQAISRLDDMLKSDVKATVASAQKMYEAGKYQEAAEALEEAWKLETFRPVLAYNLALCYNLLGERQKAAEYLDQAIAGAGAPKVRGRLSQTRTMFTTAEMTAPENDSMKKQLVVQQVRMLQRAMASMKISYAAWETSVEEEQNVLLGNPFKPIPTEPVRLACVHELK
jgi:tetratricopeptide (TPR) repeat protein